MEFSSPYINHARRPHVACYVQRVKGRGHFGRNCPYKNNDDKEPVSFEAELLEAEARGSTSALQRGDVRWIKFHEDEEPTRRRQSGHRETSPRASPRVLTRRRIAAALQLAEVTRDDKILKAERARYMRSDPQEISICANARIKNTCRARATDRRGHRLVPVPHYERPVPEP